MDVYVVSGDCEQAVFADQGSARAYAEGQLQPFANSYAGPAVWTREGETHWMWSTGQSYVHVRLLPVLADLAVNRAEAAQWKEQVMQGLESLEMSDGGRVALRRLCWLLGLSDAERAFVDAAASDATGGEPGAWWHGLMVFADWLQDEQGRTAEGDRIRRLVPQRGEVLELQYPGVGTLKSQEAAARERLGQMQARLKELGIEVAVLANPHGWRVELLRAEAMLELGWVRREDADDATRRLELELATLRAVHAQAFEAAIRAASARGHRRRHPPV